MNSAPVARGEGQVFPASRPLIPYQGPLSYPGNLRVNRPERRVGARGRIVPRLLVAIARGRAAGSSTPAPSGMAATG